MRTVLYHVHVTARRVTVTSLRALVSVVSLDTEALHATVNKMNGIFLNGCDVDVYGDKCDSSMVKLFFFYDIFMI